MSRIALVAVAVAVLLTLAAPPRRAAAAPLTGMGDDRVLLAGGPGAQRAVQRWHDLGVDVVRIHALWSRVAPAPRGRRAPAGFHPADPADPRYAFGPLDQAIDRVRAAGMRVLLTITGPGPLWATADPARRNVRLRPRPGAYANFATSVARRYAGRIDHYLLWNEPNQPGWLQPQWDCGRRGCTPASPAVYRGLVRAALPAIAAADPGAPVLVGALSPRGNRFVSANAALSPLTFLRSFGCVDARYRRVRSGACRGFRALTVDGVAHHPLGLRNAPTVPFPGADNVGFASLRRLESALDRLQRAGALRSRGGGRLGLWLDETGWQTKPPDPALGVSPALQDTYMQEEAYMAARDPRIRLVVQYNWRDEPIRVRFAGWQAGLLFSNGRAKPSLAHFATPFWLDAARGRLWGQVRPGGAHDVVVQRRAAGTRAWRTALTLRTAADGTWSRSVRLARGAAYRFVVDGHASAARRR